MPLLMPPVREVEGSSPKWLDVQVFSDKDYKPQAPSPASSMLWWTGEVKEPTRLS